MFLNALTLSPDVEIKYIGGKDPELLFLGEDGQSVEEVSSCLFSPFFFVLHWFIFFHGAKY